MSAEPVDLAWAAGLFEGEGWAGRHISYRNKVKHVEYHTGAIQIGNTDMQLLVQFRMIAGAGTIRLSKKAGEHGAVKNFFLYRVYGLKAAIIADVLLPFIISDYKRGELLQVRQALPTRIAASL